MQLSRRTMLKLLIGATAAVYTPRVVMAAPGSLTGRLSRLDQNIREAIGGREIGLDLRQVDRETGEMTFHIQVNADALYPVASCFKTWLATYYFSVVPEDQWRAEVNSEVYSVVVYSNNRRTGSLIYQIGQQVNVYGNPVEKFNDFLLFDVGMSNGLYRWDWDDNAVEGVIDVRFRPSLDERYTDLRGVRYTMDNLFTAADLAEGYHFLLKNQQDENRGPAIQKTLELCSISAPDYPSPIERSFGQDYTGKDGVLPAEPDGMGRVINDAGIIELGSHTYILSYMCAGEGEFAGIEVLGQIATALKDYESIL